MDLTKLGTLALCLLGACYLAPNDEDEGADSGAATQTGDGPSSSTGEVGDNRGRFSTGPFDFYWFWYDTWAQGTCVEVAIRNSGPDLDTWSVVFEVDQPITEWTYSGGAFFWPEDDRIEVIPTGSESFDAGEWRTLNYCAEPRHQVVDAQVDVVAASGSDGGSSTGEWTGSTNGTFTATPLSVNWYHTYESAARTCSNVTVTNGGDDLDDWALTLQLSREASVVDVTGASHEVIGSNVIFSGGAVSDGATFTVSFCAEPGVEIDGGSATVTVATP